MTKCKAYSETQVTLLMDVLVTSVRRGVGCFNYCITCYLIKLSEGYFNIASYQTNTSNHYSTELILTFHICAPNLFVFFSCVHQQSRMDHEPNCAGASPGKNSTILLQTGDSDLILN